MCSGLWLPARQLLASRLCYPVETHPGGRQVGWSGHEHDPPVTHFDKKVLRCVACHLLVVDHHVGRPGQEVLAECHAGGTSGRELLDSTFTNFAGVLLANQTAAREDQAVQAVAVERAQVLGARSPVRDRSCTRPREYRVGRVTSSTPRTMTAK